MHFKSYNTKLERLHLEIAKFYRCVVYSTPFLLFLFQEDPYIIHHLATSDGWQVETTDEAVDATMVDKLA